MGKKKKEETTPSGLAFTKQNYLLLGIGFLIIVIGFILMAGGKSDDPNVFNPGIFSFRRITLAPLIVLFGFAFEIYAIMKKTEPSVKKEE